MSTVSAKSGSELLATAEQGTSLWLDAWRRLRKNRMAVAGGATLLVFVVIALLTPWIAPYGYETQNLDLGASPPSAQHWLGTDVFGRDVLTQIMYGGRVSLAVGFIATAVALLIGVTWGAVAGYVGGRVDAVMMRLVDILYALPFMIFIVLLMVVFGRNVLLLFLAIGAVEWLTMARIMRAQVQSLRHLPKPVRAVRLPARLRHLTRGRQRSLNLRPYLQWPLGPATAIPAQHRGQKDATGVAM